MKKIVITTTGAKVGYLWVMYKKIKVISRETTFYFDVSQKNY